MPKFARKTFVSLAVLVTASFGSHPVSAEDKPKELVEAYNKAGIELFGKLSDTPGNIVMSPYSIGTALAMAAAGARGTTEKEIVQGLDYPFAPSVVADVSAALDGRVTKRSSDERVSITLANALHLTRTDGPISKSYQTLVRDKFGAEVFRGSDLAAINGWVKDKTSGKIDKLLDTLDPNSICVLLNAIRFKGLWALPFPEDKTKPRKFHLTKDETIQVDTMRTTNEFRIHSGAGFDAIALPYKGNILDMIVLLPSSKGDKKQAAIKLNDKMAKTIVDGLNKEKRQTVLVTMPKFKTEFASNLVPALESLGLKQPFNQDKADFTGMTESAEEKDRIHISQVRHKAVIEVDEAGTEAAAVTGVEFSGRSIRPKFPEFIINRPFVYMITDRASGAILFIGRLADPRA